MSSSEEEREAYTFQVVVSQSTSPTMLKLHLYPDLGSRFGLLLVQMDNEDEDNQKTEILDYTVSQLVEECGAEN